MTIIVLSRLLPRTGISLRLLLTKLSSGTKILQRLLQGLLLLSSLFLLLSRGWLLLRWPSVATTEAIHPQHPQRRPQQPWQGILQRSEEQNRWPQMTCLFLCVCSPLATIGPLHPQLSKDHLKRPHLEMVEPSPQPSHFPPLHLQGKPRTSHFQDVGRGRHRRATPSTLLLRPPIPRAQSIGSRQSSNKPLCAQPTHHLPYIQNADSGQGPELRPLRSSLDLDRPLRCVSPCPYPPPISKIPGIHPRGHAVLLPGDAIRDQYRPKDLLPGGHRGPETPPQTGNSGLGVHRRLAALEQVLQHPHNKHLKNCKTPHEIGLHRKPRKISINPDSDHNLPEYRLVGNTTHPPSQPQIHRQRHLPGSGIHSGTDAYTQTIPETPGIDQFHRLLYQSGPSPSAADHPHCSGFQVSSLKQTI